MTEQVQVTKEDEWAVGNYLDAAEAYVRPPSGSDARYLMEQAFARHRTAAEQRGRAEVIEEAAALAREMIPPGTLNRSALVRTLANLDRKP